MGAHARSGRRSRASLPGARRESDSIRGSSEQASETKARLLWNVAQLLTRLSAKQPLLLVLENLHWADESSLEMLHFTARQLGTSRVL
ncbi:MAG: AAA family ATPase, partial [Gemmatimonadaceae bacterium]